MYPNISDCTHTQDGSIFVLSLNQQTQINFLAIAIRICTLQLGHFFTRTAQFLQITECPQGLNFTTPSVPTDETAN